MSTKPPTWITQAFPDFTNLKPLGQGGQKLVLSGTHNVDGDVVLKIIHPSLDAETVRREILAVQQITSPRVPRVLAAGSFSTPFGPSIWIREQLITGITLRERLAAGVLTIDELFRLGVQLLEALEAAEQSHIVHRDVKPENIMVDLQGDFWLLDFGIARHLTMTALTPAANAFGKFTPGYAPPEQFRNIQAEIDSRADLFAFGVMFYECATRINPFLHGAIDQLEVLRRVENDSVPRLTLTCASASSIADFVSALTQRRRDHRPISVAQALAWLKSIIDEESKAGFRP